MKRALRHPWSVLAFQLARADGLRAIHGEGHDAERETPSAEPLLVKLLERPQQHGQSTLILIDEVLMYAPEKAGIDPVWRERVVDFFQYLTQAVAKVDRAALVGSQLATDPKEVIRWGLRCREDGGSTGVPKGLARRPGRGRRAGQMRSGLAPAR